ncbi:AsmA family protein [Halomonas denitrificans]|uniref:AsmA family protein n=1 Tax=Halomonas denitrificans TaxID=370769 RepID=UPI001C9A0D0C|nr:AsmA family protein [Halomonas denitrificans]MBY5969881.1 AsmA family protein [Halomonas denitrificans]
MKRLVRTLLAVVGVLALVTVGAVVYVTTFFNPEDMKPRLVAVVQEHTGLDLSLEGPLEWSFYPRIGVSVAQAEARLADQPDDAPAFAAFSRASVSLAFTPLLRGEIAIDGLTLDGLTLNLERDAEGTGNWEALLERLEDKGQDAEKALAPASAGPNPSDDGGLSVALNIASVEVTNGQLSLVDQLAQREWQADKLTINGSNVNPDTAFPLSSTFQLRVYDLVDGQHNEEGDAIASLQSDVSLDADVNLGLADSRHVLTDLTLETSTLVGGAAEPQEATLSSEELVLNLSEQRVHMAPSQLDASLLTPSLGEKRVALALAFQLESDLAAGTAQVRDIALTGPDSLSIKGNLNVTGLNDAPRYDGQVRLAPLSLHPWLARMGAMPRMTSDEALTEVALTSPVEGTLEGLSLSGLTLVLDDNTYSGSLSADFDGSRLEADLDGDRLNADNYLPPPQQDTAASGLPGISAALAQEEAPAIVPASFLAQLDERISLSLGQLVLGGQQYQDVTLEMEGEGGVHRLTEFAAGFHEGRLKATGSLDASGDTLAWQLAPVIESVRLESLLTSLGQQPAPVSGSLVASGELTTRGNARHELTRHLNGTLDTRINDGSIPRANVSRQLCTAVARLEGEQTTREWSENTRFDNISARFVIRDGVAHNDDLLITLPGIEVAGGGRLDLGAQTFDADGAARFVDTADAACSVNRRLEKVPFPVHCEGSLEGDSSQWCRFDMAAFQSNLGNLVADEAKARLNEEVEDRVGKELERLDERIGEKAGQELRDAVRGLFN